MAEWLDAAVSSAWRAHEEAMEANGEGLRMELKEMQHQLFHPMRSSESPGPGPPYETYSYVAAAPGGPAAAAIAAASIELDPRSKTGVAAKFASIVYPAPLPRGRQASYEGGSDAPPAPPAAAFGSRALWSIMLQAVGACASNLAQILASSCHEEGILFSRLWNLQTSLMDSDLMAVQHEAQGWKAEAQALADKVPQAVQWYMMPR